MGSPTLSVILPNYNHAKYLPDCLDSVLRQSWQPSEIIIIDDASKDDSVSIIKEYAAKHPVIRFFQNEKNGGAVFTINRGLTLATGDYVYFCAADDLVLPGLFEKSLQVLAQHPAAGLACSDPASFIEEADKTRRISDNHLGLSQQPAYFNPDEIVELARRKRMLVSGMSVIKRSALTEAGGFLAELKWHCDYFLVYQIIFRHGMCYLPEKLTLWRFTPGSFMSAGLRDLKAQGEVVRQMLDLLSTEKYRDIKGRFEKSGVLGLNPNVTYAVLTRKKYWSFLNLALLRYAIPTDVFWLMPPRLQKIIRNLRAKLG